MPRGIASSARAAAQELRNAYHNIERYQNDRQGEHERDKDSSTIEVVLRGELAPVPRAEVVDVLSSIH